MDKENDMGTEPLWEACRRSGRQWRQLVEFFGQLGLDIRTDLCRPAHHRWRETCYYIDVCGVQSLGIVVLICGLMGLILALQGGMVLRQYGGEIFVADTVGFSLLKELGPLMVGIIATGRAGSAFAAEIGTMKVNEEISALTTMGISPVRFLVLPKLLAMLIVLPMLAVAGDAAGLLGGLLIGVTYLGLPASAYWGRTTAVLRPDVLALGVAKCFVFAVLITLIGCWRGFQADPDAQGVGRAATGAVVTSILLLVVADLFITLFYTSIGY